MPRWWYVSLCLLATNSWAHGMAEPAEDVQAQVGAAASFSWNSKNVVANNQPWRIAGALMGGHALPTEKGAVIDDAMLWGQYRLNERTRVSGKIAAHKDGTDYPLSVESLALDYQISAPKNVKVTVGKTEAAFTPSASTHASMATFAESPLIADAFWGRSIHDTGVRLSAKPLPALEVGAEMWNGDFFPATSGQGAQDLYVKWRQAFKGNQVGLGAWAMQAKAQQRGDDRYSSGHTHGVNTTSLPADVRFTGDTDMAGVWLDLQSKPLGQVKPRLHYEALQSKSSGSLNDTTHQANYQTDHLGYALTPSLAIQNWEVSYRHEKLSLDNQLSGNGAQVLAEEADLITKHNPKRQTLQVAWRANKQLQWRVAYVKDHTATTSDNRVNIGLTWQDTLYQH